MDPSESHAVLEWILSFSNVPDALTAIQKGEMPPGGEGDPYVYGRVTDAIYTTETRKSILHPVLRVSLPPSGNLSREQVSTAFRNYLVNLARAKKISISTEDALGPLFRYIALGTAPGDQVDAASMMQRSDIAATVVTVLGDGPSATYYNSQLEVFRGMLPDPKPPRLTLVGVKPEPGPSSGREIDALNVELQKARLEARALRAEMANLQDTIDRLDAAMRKRIDENLVNEIFEDVYSGAASLLSSPLAPVSKPPSPGRVNVKAHDPAFSAAYF